MTTPDDRNTITEYAGYRVLPTTYGNQPYFINGKYIYEGYRIEKIGEAGNPMPGAASMFSRNAALQAIDLLIVSEGDATKFWHLYRAINNHRD